MNSQDLSRAFLIWSSRYGNEDINVAVEALIAIDPRFPDLKQSGWIQRTREARQLSATTLAKRAQVSRAAWRKLEQNEKKCRISLESLMKAAEALDCDLVYGLRSKNGKPFSIQIWNLIEKEALAIYVQRKRSERIIPLILANIASGLFLDPKFRKKKGWCRNQPRRKRAK